MENKFTMISSRVPRKLQNLISQLKMSVKELMFFLKGGIDRSLHIICLKSVTRKIVKHWFKLTIDQLSLANKENRSTHITYKRTSFLIFISARKRYTDLKRSLKRSLSDALEHDDVTDFGYDKRQQVSISPTFYEQLLRVQIPKAQKSCLT